MTTRAGSTNRLLVPHRPIRSGSARNNPLITPRKAKVVLRPVRGLRSTIVTHRARRGTQKRNPTRSPARVYSALYPHSSQPRNGATASSPGCQPWVLRSPDVASYSYSSKPRNRATTCSPGCKPLHEAPNRTSKRSRFITLFQAATKSWTNFFSASELP